MKIRLTYFFLFIGTLIHAQTTFKKGTFTNLNGDSKIVYIQVYVNQNFKEIKFKNDLETNIIETIPISSLMYFEIFDYQKYIRKDVPIEILDKGMFAKSNNNTIEFNITIQSYFLKVLLESENFKLLYYLDEETKNEYYFIEDKNQIELIKYKKIRTDNKVKKIKAFRKQIFASYNVKYKTTIAKLDYNSSEFVNYFKNYLNKNNRNYRKPEKAARDFKDAVNLNVSLGNGFLSQDIANNSPNFNSSSSLNLINFGLGAEYFLNDNIKSYSLVLDAKYYLKGNSEDSFTFKTINSSFDSRIKSDLSILTLNLKLRKYWQLKKSNYIFADIGIGLNKNSGNTEYIFNNNDSKFVDLESTNKNNIHYSLV